MGNVANEMLESGREIVIAWKIFVSISEYFQIKTNSTKGIDIILWNWNYFSSSIQIYELCFEHKIFKVLIYWSKYCAISFQEKRLKNTV